MLEGWPCVGCSEPGAARRKRMSVKEDFELCAAASTAEVKAEGVATGVGKKGFVSGIPGCGQGH